MTIYHVGHEYGAVTATDSGTFETTDSHFYDPTYSRAALDCATVATLGKTAAFTPLTEGYIHFRFRQQIVGTLPGYTYFLNAAGVAVIRLVWAAPGDVQPVVNIQYFNGSAWVDATSPQAVSTTSQNDFDLYFKVNTSSGAIRLYCNKSLFQDSGTINLSTIASLAQFAPAGQTNNFGQYYSELIVADVSTIGWRVATLYITGAGSTNTFTSGTYADVDEAVLTDSDAAISATANQVLTGAVNSPSPGNFVIKAVAVTARAKRDSTGPQNIQLAVRSGGTNYFSATKSLDVGYGATVGIWETDPATSAAWATLPTEIGVKSIT